MKRIVVRRDGVLTDLCTRDWRKRERKRDEKLWVDMELKF
jgi:hypothetical protein